MKFEEALQELRKGKKIKCIGKGDFISLETLKNYDLPSFFRCDLVMDGEWEVIEEPGKTFPEVFEAFKEGKYVRRKEWSTDNYLPYKRLNNQTLAFQFHPKDLLAKDWEIID